jgi:flagellar hook-basal body complex protein FliE
MKVKTFLVILLASFGLACNSSEVERLEKELEELRTSSEISCQERLETQESEFKGTLNTMLEKALDVQKKVHVMTREADKLIEVCQRKIAESAQCEADLVRCHRRRR